MKPSPFTQSTRNQPLPGDFAPELRIIDAHLSEVARQSAVPEGLSRRVFEASAGLLPDRSLRLVGATKSHSLSFASLGLQRLQWGRLAMAASVAIAGVVAAWFLQSPTIPQPTFIALHQLDDSAFSIESFDLPVADEIGSGETILANLLDTNDLTSSDDIQGELMAMNLELGM